MMRFFPKNLSQNGSSMASSDDRGVNDVVVWIQEHTNLCLVIASSAGSDMETREKLKERLASSAARGKVLVNVLLAQKGEFPSVFTRLQEVASSQNMVPVAGSARGRIAIPLSGGVRRLDEAPSSPRLRGTVTTGHGQSQMASSLTPSRTYIKEPGS